MRVPFTDHYSYCLRFPAEHTALVYNAAEVFLAASMTEGFGISIIEAARACGTPVIVTDFASMPEPVRWGMAVPPADRFWASGIESWWAWPDWHGTRDALGNAVRHKVQTSAKSHTARQDQMVSMYAWNVTVNRHWRPVLGCPEGLSSEINAHPTFSSTRFSAYE